MSRPSYHRNAVYLCRVPSDWRPQRYWDLPPTVTSVALHARNLGMKDAQGSARTHNKAQMQRVYNRLPVETWALVAKCIRPGKRYSQDTQQESEVRS